MTQVYQVFGPLKAYLSFYKMTLAFKMDLENGFDQIMLVRF